MALMRYIITIILFLSISHATFSQIDSGHNDVGVKVGVGFLGDVILEFNYQIEYDFMRNVELDLFTYFQARWIGYGGAVLHKWRFPIKQKWTWYAGAGLAVGSWHRSLDSHVFRNEGAFLAIPIDFGIEYNLMDSPWRFGIDLRYNIPLINQPGEDVYPMFTFSTRYLF